MKEQSLKDKTAKGLFWGGLSNGFQQLLNIVIGVVLARILSPADYGITGMLAIFIALSSTIMDCGFVNALINKKSITHKDYNSVFWFSAFAGIALYVLLYVSAPFIALFYGNPELTDLSRFLFLCILVGAFGIVHNAILLKELRLREKAKIDIISLTIAGSVGVILALLGFSYWALAAQTVIYSSLLTIFRWYFIKWRPSFAIDFSPIKEMFGFSSKIFITNIFQYSSYNLLSVIFGRFYDETQVGLYSQGQKWMSMGQSFIGGTIQSIAQPVLTQITGDTERQKYVFRKILRFGAFVSFPLMLGLAFVSKEFILIALGEEWAEAVPFLMFFCIWGAFSYIGTLYTNLLIAHGKSDLCMYGMILTTIVQLLLVLLLHPYGIFTMLTAYLLTYFVALFGWNYHVHKVIGLKVIEVLKDIFPYLIITLLSVFAAWLITRTISNNFLLLASRIVLVGSFYVLAMWKSNSAIFKESLNFLLKEKK